MRPLFRKDYIAISPVFQFMERGGKSGSLSMVVVLVIAALFLVAALIIVSRITMLVPQR